MFLPRARQREETPSLGREGEIFYGGVVSGNERDGLCLGRYESFSFNPHLGSKYKESCRLLGTGRGEEVQRWAVLLRQKSLLCRAAVQLRKGSDAQGCYAMPQEQR